MPAQQLYEPTVAERSKMDKLHRLSGALPYNPSSQRLMDRDDEGNSSKGSSDSLEDGAHIMHQDGNGGAMSRSTSVSPNFISRRQWCTVLILFFVNLINYMDRLTIAGKKHSFIFYDSLLR